MNKVLYCKKAVLIPAVIAIMVAGGCSSDDDNDETQRHDLTLKFQVSEAPLENPEASAASTRTAETTTTSLSSFNYHYIVNSKLSGQESATQKDRNGLWTASSGWPESAGENTLVPFYAYANAILKNSDDILIGDDHKVYLNFTVDELTYSTKDLLVAKASDTYSHSNGFIRFTFSHACGALRFSLNKTSSLDSYTVQVNSVIIHNIPCSGAYCFDVDDDDDDDDDETWTIYTNEYKVEKNFTILSYDENHYLTVKTDNPDNPERTYLSADGDYLFLIPQTLTPWNPTGPLANAYVEIKCKIYKDGTYKVGKATEWGYAYLPLNINIAQGKINPVHISMGTALRDASGNKYFN